MARTSPRFDIEALRAFAVLSVMLFHGGIAGLNGGFAGVDIFFVISGYLIVGLLHNEWLANGRIQLADFWGRRARRLLPAAAVVLAVTAVLAPLLSGRLAGSEIRLDLIAATFYAANLRFGISGSDYWSLDYVSPALHFWSLGVEEQFYIFTPIAIVLGSWLLRGRTPRWLPAAVLATLSALSFIYCLWLSAKDPIWSYYSPIARIWEFSLGGLMAVLPREERFRPSARLKRLAWLALIWSVVLAEPGNWPNITALMPVVATAVLLRIGHDGVRVADLSANVLGKYALRPIAYVGGISYSAYLWHWPVLWVASSWQGLDTPEDLSAFVAIPLLLIALGLAAATKKYVEDPWRFAPRLTASPARSLGTGWATSTGAVGVVGLSMVLPAAALLPPPLPAPAASATPTASEQVDPDQQWVDELVAQLAPLPDHAPDLAAATPAVDKLSADKPSNTRVGCNLDKNSVAPGEDCEFGAVNSRESIALFGDSHADQYFAGLDAAAKSLNLKLLVFTKPSCPAADATIWLYHEQRPYPQCDEYRKAAIAQLAAAKPRLVIVSSLVTYSVIDPATGKLAELARGQELWRAGVERTLEQLTAAGLRVLLIRDLPSWGTDIAECLATYDAATCSPAPDLWPKADDFKIANRIEGALGIDLSGAVCEPAKCFPVRDGTLVVRDDTHLSATYSGRLAPLWKALLAGLLGRI